MSAETALYGVFGRFAKIRQNWQAAGATGTDFWTRVDAAGDETFENRLKGQDLTDLDTAIENGSFGGTTYIRNVLSRATAYLSYPTTGSEPGLGYTSDPWNTYLAATGQRVPYEFAEIYYDCYGIRLDPENVFPKGTWAADIGDNASAGLHDFGEVLNTTGTWAFTADDGALDTDRTVGAAIIAVSNVGVTGNVTMTITCTNQTGDGVDITLTDQAFSADSQIVLGQESLTSTADAAQKVVAVAATGQFTDEEWVLLRDSDGVTERAQIDSIVTNTSLTMKDNLIHSFTTGKSATVWPLFTDVESIDTASGGLTTEAIQLYARPDWAIAL